MRLPSSVQIVETGPGDGFAREKVHLPTQVKVEIVRRVAEAGVAEVVAARFAEEDDPPPKLADAAAVLERLRGELPPEVSVAGRVAGAAGARRALEAGAGRLVVAVPATDGWGLRHEGSDRNEALRRIAEVAGLAGEAGASVVAVIPAAFGCPIEGPVPQDAVAELVETLSRDTSFGPPVRITLDDAPGLATPVGAERLVADALGACAPERLGVRLSDTRGLALANGLAALQAGARILEGAVAGVGGSPVEPGAPGPVPTEDLVYLCGELGVDAGVDFRGLRRTARRTVEAVARPLPSRTVNVDPRERVYARIRR